MGCISVAIIYALFYETILLFASYLLIILGNRKGHRDPPGKKYRFVRLVCFGEEEEKKLRI
ncbi:hypothetical protein KJ633_08200, partial [bacterium]|nr:hypothetical protein [bacterium]